MGGREGGTQSPVLWGDSGISDTGMAQGRGRTGAGVPAGGGMLRQLSCLDVCNDHLTQ